MKPHGRRRILILAATVSLISHWLVLRGVDAGWMSDGWFADTPQTSSVMVAQLQGAPVAAAKTPPQGRVSETGAATDPPSAAKSTAGQPPPADEKSADVHEAQEKTDNADAPAKTAAASVTTIQSGQQTFQVFLGDGEGDALAMVNHTLRVNDGHYELSSRGEALGLLAMLYSGLLTQHSSGLLDAGGFSTQKYSEQRGKKPETRAEVDPTEPIVRFSHGGQATLNSRRVHDRLSVMYELALMVRAQPDLQRTPDLQVLSGQALETWRFVRVGTDEIVTEGHRVAALHFKRQTSDEGERTGIDLWLDTSGNGWPVQIRLTDKKGTVITQRRQ